MNIDINTLQNNWKQFQLTNNNGMIVTCLNYGGIITNISTPDKNGQFENVVLGYKNIQGYSSDAHFLGAIIGRVAGRIEGASFSLHGKQYNLEKNDGDNHLHSGINGFHRVIWDAEPFQTKEAIGVKFSHASKEIDDGFPGNIHVHVTYSLNNANQLIIDYAATTDATTYVTLTNHSYINLSGNVKNTIHQHHITFNSNKVAELNDDLIPTGKIVGTANSSFDFTNKRKLSDGITSNTLQNKIVGNGYDHYFLFDEGKQGKIFVEEASSGRTLTIETDQPGMVMYTANNLDEGIELMNGTSKKHAGVCFETQASPAALHHDGFPNMILHPDETYKKETIFTFGVNK